MLPAALPQHPQDQTAPPAITTGKLGVSTGGIAAVTGDERLGQVRASPAEEMVAVGGKMCGNLRCSKKPSYDYASNDRRQFCGEHAADDVVGVKNKLCAYSGCLKHPLYGVAGSKWIEFCSEHAVDVVVRISCKE